MAKKWLTIKEATLALEVSDRTLRRWIDDKKIKSKRINRITHVLIDDAFTKPQDETPQQETQNNRQAENEKQNESANHEPILFTELVKQLEVKDQQIKNLGERLQEMGLLLNNAQRQLAPPREEKTAEGEVIGFDKKNVSEGIVDAKKSKFLSDVTQILVVLVLTGVLIAVVVITYDYFAR